MGKRWMVKSAAGRLPDCNPLKVFYWSIESRVNAAGSSATIADNALLAGRAWLRLDSARECGAFQAKGSEIRQAAMVDLLNLAMLIAASVGSMAFGILAAYGILRAGFALMRPRQRTVAVKARKEAASVS